MSESYTQRIRRVMDETMARATNVANVATIIDAATASVVASQVTLAGILTAQLCILEELQKLRLVAELAYAPRSDRGTPGGSTPSEATKVGG